MGNGLRPKQRSLKVTGERMEDSEQNAAAAAAANNEEQELYLNTVNLSMMFRMN